MCNWELWELLAIENLAPLFLGFEAAATDDDLHSALIPVFWPL